MVQIPLVVVNHVVVLVCCFFLSPRNYALFSTHFYQGKGIILVVRCDPFLYASILINAYSSALDASIQIYLSFMCTELSHTASAVWLFSFPYKKAAGKSAA